MTTETATKIVSSLSRWGRVSLLIIVDEARGLDFATAAARVLGSDFRAQFQSVAGRQMTDAEIRAEILAHATRCVAAAAKGGAL